MTRNQTGGGFSPFAHPKIASIADCYPKERETYPAAAPGHLLEHSAIGGTLEPGHDGVTVST
jgi:hypothetical protein